MKPCKIPGTIRSFRGFSMLEIIIAASILLVLIASLFLGTRTPSKKTPARMDEIQALSHFHRLSATLHKQIQKSKQVLVPPTSDLSTGQLVLKMSNGQITQYYFQAEGSLMERPLPGRAIDGKPLIRLPSAVLSLDSVRFEKKTDGSIMMYATYKRTEGGQELVLAEAFDCIHSPF